MTDAELDKWLREELSSYGRDYYDRDDVGEAITALVALLGESEAAIAWGMNDGDDGLENTIGLDAVRKLQARLRVVLGEGR